MTLLVVIIDHQRLEDLLTGLRRSALGGGEAFKVIGLGAEALT